MGTRSYGQDIHLVGAGNSAGQAALHFANHARRVTLVVRGEKLEKSMSHYLVEQLRSKSNIAVQPRADIVVVHGERNPTAIDIRDIASNAVQRHDPGAFSYSSGQTRKPAAGQHRSRQAWIRSDG
jgi:thioredoxin reductase (NADPH)